MYMLNMYTITHLLFFAFFAACEAETKTGLGTHSGDVSEQLQDLQNMYAALKDELHVMREEKISQASSLNSLSNEIKNIQVENNRLREEYVELKVEQDKTKKELNNLRNKFKNLKNYKSKKPKKVNGFWQKFDTSIHREKGENREQPQIGNLTQVKPLDGFSVENGSKRSISNKLSSSGFTMLESANSLSVPFSENKRRRVGVGPVGFTARLSSSLSNLGRDQIIIFDSMASNTGHNYNPSTGVFTCYYAGIYMFFANIVSHPEKRVGTEIVHNGNEVVSIYSANNHFYGSGCNMVILNLSEGDTVWTRVDGDYHSTGKEIDGKTYSTFSGFLIQ